MLLSTHLIPWLLPHGSSPSDDFVCGFACVLPWLIMQPVLSPVKKQFSPATKDAQSTVREIFNPRSPTDSAHSRTLAAPLSYPILLLTYCPSPHGFAQDMKRQLEEARQALSMFNKSTHNQ
jgi:hypothetical protein